MDCKATKGGKVTLGQPSRTIIVQPLEVPEPPAREPESEPAEPVEPEPSVPERDRDSRHA